MYKSFSVLEKSKPPNPHSVLLQRRGKDETLLFESQAVAVLCKLSQSNFSRFQCCISASPETEVVKKEYTKILDAYGCLGVLQLYSGDTTVLYLVMVTGCFSVGKIGDSEIFRITQTQFVPLHYQQNEDRIADV